MQALRKEPLTVYGDGKQTRSFQYVSDLVMPNKPTRPSLPLSTSFSIVNA